MKYKDFKTMTQDEMKQVKGGSQQITGCVAHCRMHGSAICGTPCDYDFAVNVASCTADSYIVCGSAEFISCGCKTYQNP